VHPPPAADCRHADTTAAERTQDVAGHLRANLKRVYCCHE
jgi:hypothetical protein